MVQFLILSTVQLTSGKSVSMHVSMQMVDILNTFCEQTAFLHVLGSSGFCPWCEILPYILAYKQTIFGSILTFKLWGSTYIRVMPHSQSLHDGYWLATLTVYVPHKAWTISRSLRLCGCVGRARRFE